MGAQAKVVPPPGFSPPGVDTGLPAVEQLAAAAWVEQLGGGSVGGGSVGAVRGCYGCQVGVILITGVGESVMVGVVVGLPMVILATYGWLASPLLLTATTEMA